MIISTIKSLFFGKVPKESYLVQYQLDEYIPFITAYKTGNVKLFEESLEILEERFILLGAFLITEKLKGFVFRNFIRRIYKNYDFSEMKSPNIKIELIYTILTKVFDYNEMSMEEFEFYLIGIIYRGLILGYIHFDDKTFVFAKDRDPFPKIGAVFEKKYDKFFT